jgi:hypothetical protein
MRQYSEVNFLGTLLCPLGGSYSNASVYGQIQKHHPDADGKSARVGDKERTSSLVFPRGMQVPRSPTHSLHKKKRIEANEQAKDDYGD